jgi:hypothetical protein
MRPRPITLRKAATYIGVAFVVFFVLSSPTDAGDVVQAPFDGLRQAAEALAAFVKACWS